MAPVPLYGILNVSPSHFGTRDNATALTFIEHTTKLGLTAAFLAASDVIGIRGIVVYALSDAAKRFCANAGFDPSPLDSMTLMATIADLRDEL